MDTKRRVIRAKANCYICKNRYKAEDQDYCTKYKQGIPIEVLRSDSLYCDLFNPFFKDQERGCNE